MQLLSRAIALLTASSLTACLAGCASMGGPIKVGITFDQPGLSLKQGESYSGFDVEMARYIVREMGYDPAKIIWVETKAPQRETFLRANQVRLVFSTYPIDERRRQRVGFAGPYFTAGQDLLVAEDSPIVGPENLNGRRLCSVVGTDAGQVVRERYAPRVQLVGYDSFLTCVKALDAGDVDAVTGDNAILAGYAAQPQFKGHLRVVEKAFTTERYGIGMRKGDVKLCQKVNAAYQKMVDSGEWQRSMMRTLGKSGFVPDMKVNPPAPEPCR